MKTNVSKMRKLFSILIITLIACGKANAQFLSLNTGVTEDLQSVYFVDNNLGYVVGNNGTIIKTLDGGYNWSVQTSGTTETLKDVYFKDASNGFVAGSNGTLLATSDGGNTWSTYSTGLTSQLNAIAFADASIGYVVGNDGNVLLTLDGGLSWTKYTAFGTTKDLYNIAFVGFDGFIVGEDGTLYSTINAVSWSKESLVSGYQNVDLLDIEMKSKDEALLLTSNNTLYPIYYGTSSFYSYFSSTIPTSGSIKATAHLGIDYLNTGGVFGFAVGDKGSVLEGIYSGDINSPISWDNQSQSSTVSYNDVQMLPDTIAYIVGNSGEMLKAADISTCYNGLCVWPGDANLDLVADVSDLLQLGIAFGQTGATRPNATNNYTGQHCADWKMNFLNTADFKHSDCNGDGMVNLDDTMAVYLNYGQIHNKTIVSNPFIASQPSLYLEMSADKVGTGNSMSASIKLGDSNIPINDVYGLAFTIHYDADLVANGSIGVNFSNSWLGKQGFDLVSMQRNFDSDGELDVVLVKTDKMNISGNGEICKLSFSLSSGSFANTNEVKKLSMEITNAKVISFDETKIDVNTLSDSVEVFYDLSKINESKTENKVMVYPNPANEFVYIEGANIKDVSLQTLLGQTISGVISIYNGRYLINTKEVAEGVYLISYVNNSQLMNKKIYVNH